MKRIIVFLIALSTYTNTFVHSQSQPVTFDPNMLAYSKGLPNDLLIFVPDSAVQILFNPARASTFGGSFVYINYLPQSGFPIFVTQFASLQSSFGVRYPYSSGPTLSFVSLVNNGASQWLLQFSNSVNRYSSGASQSENPPPIYAIGINGQSDNSYVSNSSQTAIKLSKVTATGGGSYSLGLFGILFPANSTSDNTSSSISDALSISPPTVVSHQYSSYQSHSASTDSKYVLGLEYSAAEPKSDLVVSLSLQKNIIKNTGLSQNNNGYSYTSAADTNSSSNVTHSSTSNASEPFIVGVHAYYQHSSDLVTPFDHFFISPNFYYSDGTLTYNQSGYRYYYYKPSGNPIVGDTVQSQSSKDEQIHDWGTLLSMGYVVTQRLLDIDILVGINPQVGYDNFTDINSFYSSYYYSGESSMFNPIPFNTHEIWSAIVQIPVHVNFTPTNWFSLLAGLNYRYSYFHEKINSSYPLEQNLKPVTGTTVQSGSQILSSLYGTTTIFAGAQLRHASRLQTQIAFQGDLTNYSYWNISLGYIY